jgi:hypothetical protein
VLTSLPDGVFLLEGRDDGSKVTCKLWPVQSRLPVQCLGCDDDKEVTTVVLGSIVLLNGIDLRPTSEQPVCRVREDMGKRRSARDWRDRDLQRR